MAGATDPTAWAVSFPECRERITRICRYMHNRTPVRVLLTCALARAHKPHLDPRCPFTEIKSDAAFSGRTQYDEPHVGPFITRHRLPCNSTTGFLTPAMRTKDQPISANADIVGKPKWVYKEMAQVLDDLAEGRVSAEAILADVVRVLVVIREEHAERLAELKAALPSPDEVRPLSSEAIVTLLQQHLACPRSSRLPVLIVAAAYEAVAAILGERHAPLTAHNAADEQTGAAGDVEIILASGEQVLTVYEMKRKRLTLADVERAKDKAGRLSARVDNYLFVTTEPIDPGVVDYANALYPATGTEFAVLDCLGFARHFLHIFHRYRTAFLEAYQELVLGEPESAVNFDLKQAFLTLRKAAVGTDEG